MGAQSCIFYLYRRILNYERNLGYRRSFSLIFHFVAFFVQSLLWKGNSDGYQHWNGNFMVSFFIQLNRFWILLEVKNLFWFFFFSCISAFLRLYPTSKYAIKWKLFCVLSSITIQVLKKLSRLKKNPKPKKLEIMIQKYQDFFQFFFFSSKDNLYKSRKNTLFF